MSQSAFLEANPGRAQDGSVISVFPVTSFVIGRISQKEVPTPGMMVFTERALYEFKGALLTGKETRRIPYDDFIGVVLNIDIANRFLPMVRSAVKATRAYEVGNRSDFVLKLRQTASVCNPGMGLLVCEFGEQKIAQLLASLPHVNVAMPWPDIISALERGTLQRDAKPATSSMDVRKSLRSTKSAVAGGSNRRPLMAVSNNFVSSLWDQISAAMDTPQTAEETQCCRILTGRLSAVLPIDRNGVLMQPRDEAEALIAVALILCDPQLCKMFVSTLLLPRNLAQDVLGDLEESLGNAVGLIRRWAAVSIFAGLPTFDLLSSGLVSSGWLLASKLLMDQVRMRENALVHLLFPAIAPQNASVVAAINRSKQSLIGQTPAVEVADSVLKKASPLPAPTPRNATRRASNMLSSIMGASTSNNANPGLTIGEEDFGDAAGGRRQRATLTMMWMSRLLDLEDLGPGSAAASGIMKSDVQTLFQFLLGRTADATSEDARNVDFEVETFGASVEFPEFFAPIFASLTATRSEEVRCIGLKQLNVLLMRNTSSMRAMLGVQDWQSIIFSTLYNVPLLAAQRRPTQDDTYSYAMHMITMIHLSVLGSKSPLSEFGPVDKLFGQTIYKLAVHSGWGEPTVAVVRSLFKGIFSTLAKQASSPTCSWRYNPTHDEWEEIFRLSHLLQTFLFYRPVNLGLRDVSETVAKASREVGSNKNLGPFTDWRARIEHHPLLNRVENERLVTAHRQMFAKMNLPVMTAAHRGEEIGIHLDDNGMCHDRNLVETACKLWTALGITGNELQDRKKSEELSTKADKSRILYASNVCRELTEVIRLFDLVDEKRAAVIKAATKSSTRKVAAELTAAEVATTVDISLQQRDQLSAIAHSKTQDFLYKQKTKEQNVGFLSKAKANKTAMNGLNLRTNLLQKRTDVVRKLGSGSDSVQPKTVNVPPPAVVVVVHNTNNTGAATATADAKNEKPLLKSRSVRLHIRADEDTVPLTYDQSVRSPRASTLEDHTVFEKAMRSASSLGAMEMSSPGQQQSTLYLGRKTQIHLKAGKITPAGSRPNSPTANTAIRFTLPSIEDENTGNAEEDKTKKQSGDFTLNKKRSRTPTCFGCNTPIHGELDEVQKFGQTWHAECLICSNCSKPVVLGQDKPVGGLVGDRSSVNYMQDTSSCKFFPNAALLLCSNRCQDEVLAHSAEKRCAGCMDDLLAEDTIVSACGRNFHVETQCFRCTSCDLPFDSSRPYFEVLCAAYCASCMDTKFRNCKACSLPLLDSDKVVEAQKWQYHDRCFCCVVCKEAFQEDGFFPGQHEGELLCYTHHLEQRTPPCTYCHLPFNPKVEGDAPVCVAGMNFHRHCLQCSKCSRRLAPLAEPGSDEAAEEHDGQLFCTECYAEDFGLQCHRCKLGIKGDILHAGIGKRGETINWHPECFACQDCSTLLLEIPFFLVAVGDSDLVTVCSEHFHSRYSNQTCPGCNGFVSPSRNKFEGGNEAALEDLLLGVTTPGPRRTASFIKWDNNPAIMYEDKMWHARCLTCEEPNCGVGLYEDSNLANANLYQVQTARGLRVCNAHFQASKNTCFTCEQVIEQEEEMTEMMGWTFHDNAECFCCTHCKAPIEPDQALIKMSNGPAHQKCPSAKPLQKKKSSLFEKISLKLGGSNRKLY